MSELKKDIRQGGSAEFQIADKVISVEAMTLGKLKNVFLLIMEVSKGAQSGDVMFIPQIMDNYLFKVIPLLIDTKKFAFMTQEWVEENMTMPQLREIFNAAVEINGLKDFFGKAFGGTLTTKAPEVSPPNPGPTPLIP
jgi:hypothetical protein